MAVIGLEDDIGFAALLFVLFIGHAVGGDGPGRLPGPRRWCSSAVGAYVAARYFGQVHLRVDEWQNPWQTATNPTPAATS